MCERQMKMFDIPKGDNPYAKQKTALERLLAAQVSAWNMRAPLQFGEAAQPSRDYQRPG
jgi:hypothetical protein